MTQPVEGTFILDGMIQGKLPDVPEAAAKLRQWLADCPLGFTAQHEGKSFSFLAPGQPRGMEKIKGELAPSIVEQMNRLLEIFPPFLRAQVLSTIRSREFRKDLEVQTLYVIGPDGTVHTRQNEVEVKTAAPQPPLTRKDKVRMAVTAAGVMIVLLGVSTFFIDYGSAWANLVDRVVPLDPAGVKVEVVGLEEFVTVEARPGARRDEINLTFTRIRRPAVGVPATNPATGPSTAPSTAPATGPAASPTTPATTGPVASAHFANPLFAEPTPEMIRRHLALEAMVCGYIRCEFFDKDGKFQRMELHRIGNMLTGDKAKLTLRIPTDNKPAMVRITY